ncbi:MFS transporter [Bacillota bacterium Meth-B3]
MDTRRISHNIVWVQGTYTAMVCVSIAFFVQAFQRFGIDKMTIGLITMACNITSVITQPVWGFLADRSGRQREIVIVACTLGAALYFLMMYSGGALRVIVACAMGIYASFYGMMHLITSWIAKLMVENPDINYGATRSIGSLTYAVTAVVLGFSVTKFSPIIAPYCFFGLNLILCAAVVRLPNPARGFLRGQGASLRDTWGYLRGNLPFVVLVAAYFLNTFCVSTVNTFYSVVMFELGGNEGHVGIGLFCIAMVEVPFMFFYKKLMSRGAFSNAALLCVAMVSYALQCFLTSSGRSVTAVMLAGVLQGLSYGVIMPATVAYMVEFVDKRHLGFAQMTLGAMGQSLGAIIASPLAGALSASWGTQPMMRLMSLFSLAGAALLLLGSTIVRHRGGYPVGGTSTQSGV